jgi:hypothetical protein
MKAMKRGALNVNAILTAFYVDITGVLATFLPEVRLGVRLARSLYEAKAMASLRPA